MVTLSTARSALRPAGHRVVSHPTYAEARGAFSWRKAWTGLAGLPGGRVNIAHEAVDRHVAEGNGERTAIRVVAADGATTSVSYAELRDLTNRFASVLASLGVQKGDGVMSLLGSSVDQYVATFGTLKHGAVFSPLLPSLGAEPIRDRLSLGSARVVVTTPALYRRTVAPIRDALPHLEHVLVVGGRAGRRTLDLSAALADASPDHPIVATDPEDRALLHFTRGTTGRPKAAVHVHAAVVAHHATAAYALDLRPGDVFWCGADPAWVPGTSYGIIAPLTHGATLVTCSGAFDPRRCYQVLAEQEVDVWCTSPAALQGLVRHGAGPAHGLDLGALRHVVSVGDALAPEVIDRAYDALGLAVHDGWGQTETGAIVISNHPGATVRPGSMGRPVPGIDAAVLVRGEDGRARVTDGVATLAPCGEVGELALRPGWPSMCRCYLHDEGGDACRIDGGWYLSGDLARIDDDGYFWFAGRADGVPGTSGRLDQPEDPR